jgi:hypothetical protein
MYVLISSLIIRKCANFNQPTKNEPKGKKQGRMTRKMNDPKRVPPKRPTERLKQSVDILHSRAISCQVIYLLIFSLPL